LTSLDLDVRRIGFGLHSLFFAQDRFTAYKLVEELVPSVRLIEPEVTTDFLYQINRPVSSRELGEGVRLNRLMKWSTLFAGHTQFEATPDTAQIGPVFGRHYASLDTDTNTPAEHLAPLDKGKLGVIYDELVELAWTNLEAGEIA